MFFVRNLIVVERVEGIVVFVVSESEKFFVWIVFIVGLFCVVILIGFLGCVFVVGFIV